MAEGKEGAEGAQGEEGKKGGEGTKKDPVPYERFESEVSRRHKAEEKLAAFEKTQKEQNEASLKEQNKFKELWEGAAPKVKLADELEKSVGEYFNEEIADLSDEHKALIPEGALHTKLAWVKKAKKAGVFGTQNPNPDKTFNGKPRGGLPPEKWYLDLKEGDPKIAQLTTGQYTEWKNHNRQNVGAPVRGGF